MKAQPILAFLLLAALSTPVFAQQSAVRSLRQEVALGDVDRVQVKLSIGDLTIEGIDGTNVEIELTLDCSREDPETCKQRAERVRLAPRVKRGELRVRLKNTPRARLRGIQARMAVRIPRHVPLEVDVTNGDLHVSGMRSHINVNSGGGDVDVTADRAGAGEVNVDVGLGGADLWLGEERIKGTGWPRALNWKGTGAAHIEIDVVGVGDVSVRLE